MDQAIYMEIFHPFYPGAFDFVGTLFHRCLTVNRPIDDDVYNLPVVLLDNFLYWYSYDRESFLL